MDLLDSQKAEITVSHDDGAGNVTDLGDQYHFTFDPAGVADIAGGFVRAIAAGETNLHITTMANTLPVDVAVTVTADSTGEHLVVTFGAPVPK